MSATVADALARADVVVTATPMDRPLFSVDAVAAGCLVVATRSGLGLEVDLLN